ncbi:hypothetical protein DPMN_038837 [Dreissena polymorpha]|uniref:Uncharacterized protein n=1 Tax=Dreissena polymorpha TaxID=45954 RepID=A0A9D4MG96_DREPO|nr:hypothetical protein DPMN_038837 [Dreissena polymorpha]
MIDLLIETGREDFICKYKRPQVTTWNGVCECIFAIPRCFVTNDLMAGLFVVNYTMTGGKLKITNATDEFHGTYFCYKTRNVSDNVSIEIAEDCINTNTASSIDYSKPTTAFPTGLIATAIVCLLVIIVILGIWIMVKRNALNARTRIREHLSRVHFRRFFGRRRQRYDISTTPNAYWYNGRSQEGQMQTRGISMYYPPGEQDQIYWGHLRRNLGMRIHPFQMQGIMRLYDLSVADQRYTIRNMPLMRRSSH